MKRPGGNGKWWLLFVVVCGLALWYRLHDRGGDAPHAPPPPPPPVVVPAPAPAPDAAVVVVTEPPPPSDPVAVTVPLHITDWRLVRLSADGARALLEQGQHVRRLRVVTVATGAVETDLDLAAYDADDHAHDAIVVDALARIRPALRGFPFGATSEIASTPDGTAGVYNDGDKLRTMRGDKLGPPFKTAAGYDPIALPDGKTVLFRSYHGRIGDQGVYALAWATLDSPAVHDIDGTLDVTGPWSATADVLHVVATPVGETRRCILEVPLAKPFKPTRTRCLDGTAHDGDYPSLSPNGAWAAWDSPATADEPRRVRVMNLATGDITLDARLPADAFPTEVVSDTGRAIVRTDAGSYQYDPVTSARHPVTIDTSLTDCIPRGDQELVCASDGSVVVVPL